MPFRLSDTVWKSIQPLEEEAEQKQVIEKKYEVKIDAGEEFLSSLETEIVEVFAEVLGYRNIRVSDNFFQMGGDSIVAMKIINLIYNQRSTGGYLLQRAVIYHMVGSGSVEVYHMKGV